MPWVCINWLYYWLRCPTCFQNWGNSWSFSLRFQLPRPKMSWGSLSKRVVRMSYQTSWFMSFLPAHLGHCFFDSKFLDHFLHIVSLLFVLEDLCSWASTWPTTVITFMETRRVIIPNIKCVLWERITLVESWLLVFLKVKLSLRWWKHSSHCILEAACNVDESTPVLAWVSTHIVTSLASLLLLF